MRIQTTSQGGFVRMCILCALDVHQVNAHSCECNRSRSDAHSMRIKVPMWKRLRLWHVAHSILSMTLAFVTYYMKQNDGIYHLIEKSLLPTTVQGRIFVAFNFHGYTQPRKLRGTNWEDPLGIVEGEQFYTKPPGIEIPVHPSHICFAWRAFGIYVADYVVSEGSACLLGALTFGEQHMHIY